MTIFSKEVCNIDGKTGAFISKYMHKNGLSNEYNVAYNLCNTYSTWVFYYGETKTITSHTII